MKSKFDLFSNLIDGVVTIKINSDTLSMSPLIVKGDYVMVEKNYCSIKNGDILLVKPLDDEDYILCHRYIRRVNSEFTKGDNNWNKDYYSDIDSSIKTVYIATVVGIRRNECYTDLSTRRSKIINRIISVLSAKCYRRSSIFATEMIFALNRILILLFQLLYSKRKFYY